MGLFRPLSRRNIPDARFDEYHSGLPGHLLAPAMHWLVDLTSDIGLGARQPNVEFMRSYQVEAVLEPPLNWNSPQRAYDDLMTRFQRYPEFALDTLDYALAKLWQFDQYSAPNRAQSLANMLESGRSAWVVMEIDSGGWRLVRRSLGPVAEAISSVEGTAQRAHQHLVEAWKKLAGRPSDSSGAYREAVRAVEAASKPVVLPNDSIATLGKVIKAIKDKPSKWTFVLGQPDDVAAMCGLLWTSQLDRHGTDDESVPLNVSSEQADASVHLAITLVRYFAGGLFRPA